VPLIRYFFLIGSILAAIIYVIGDTETAATAPADRGWTALDTLRAMAHHGEPAQRAASLVYNNAAEPAGEVAIALDPAPQAAVQPNTQSPPTIANVQPRIRPKQETRENLPRRNRQTVVHPAMRNRTVADADRLPRFDLFGSQW
jgi:hypothetical protein